MRIEKKNIGEVVVISPRGKLLIGRGDVELRKFVSSVFDEGAKKVVLDLKDVKDIDSAGVGELVAIHTSAHKRGIEVKLARVPERVLGILQIAQLAAIFDINDTVEEAVDSFSADKEN